MKNSSFYLIAFIFFAFFCLLRGPLISQSNVIYKDNFIWTNQMMWQDDGYPVAGFMEAGFYDGFVVNIKLPEFTGEYSLSQLKFWSYFFEEINFDANVKIYSISASNYEIYKTLVPNQVTLEQMDAANLFTLIHEQEIQEETLNTETAIPEQGHPHLVPGTSAVYLDINKPGGVRVESGTFLHIRVKTYNWTGQNLAGMGGFAKQAPPRSGMSGDGIIIKYPNGSTKISTLNNPSNPVTFRLTAKLTEKTPSSFSVNRYSFPRDPGSGHYYENNYMKNFDLHDNQYQQHIAQEFSDDVFSLDELYGHPQHLAVIEHQPETIYTATSALIFGSYRANPEGIMAFYTHDTRGNIFKNDDREYTAGADEIKLVKALKIPYSYIPKNPFELTEEKRKYLMMVGTRETPNSYIVPEYFIPITPCAQLVNVNGQNKWVLGNAVLNNVDLASQDNFNTFYFRFRSYFDWSDDCTCDIIHPVTNAKQAIPFSNNTRVFLIGN